MKGKIAVEVEVCGGGAGLTPRAWWRAKLIPKVPPELIYPSPAGFDFREHVVSKLAKQLARDEPI